MCVLVYVLVCVSGREWEWESESEMMEPQELKIFGELKIGQQHETKNQDKNEDEVFLEKSWPKYSTKNILQLMLAPCQELSV